MAGQLVVVADNRSLSLGLTGLEQDVIDLRPQEASDWLATAATPVALVIGVESADHALEILAGARQRHESMPVLLVSSPGQGWEHVSLESDEQVAVLPLPVTRLSLVKGVQRLLSPAPVAAAAAEPTSAVHDEPLPTPHHRLDEATPPTAPVRLVAARSTDALRERLARRAADHVPAPPPAMADLATVRAAVEPVLERPPTTHANSAAFLAGDTPELVRTLLSRVDQLCDVRDAATAVIEEAVSVSGGEAGVLLLPDGGVWHVCGASSSVRPLEWRYVVEPDSWLVATVVDADRGVIVEDSDIARQRLGGAPLAHRQQLMAAPVPGARGLAMVARDHGAFTEDELGAMARAIIGAGELLAETVLVRTLARALSEFRGVDD